MLPRARVEEHLASFVEGLETDPVALVEVLVFEHDHLPVRIVGAEPLRLFGGNCFVVIPHPESEVRQAFKSVCLRLVLDEVFIVDFRQ